MPFNVDCESVKTDLQLELIELQSNNELKQLFRNIPFQNFSRDIHRTDTKIYWYINTEILMWYEMEELTCNMSVKKEHDEEEMPETRIEITKMYRSLLRVPSKRLVKFLQNPIEINLPKFEISNTEDSCHVCIVLHLWMKLRKNTTRNRLTDNHLAAQLRISSSQLEPDYEELSKAYSQFHRSHAPSSSYK